MTILTKEAERYIKANQSTIPYYKQSVEEARAERASLVATPYTVPELHTIENITFQARDGANINARIYTPKGTGPFPIIVFYHGGGWVFGNLESTDGGCQLLAIAAKSIVISVDYRLAPEYKFPTPLHNAYDGLLWAYENATSFNGLADQIAVAGDSAGGNLATATALLATQQNGPTLTAQVLIYPVTDISKKTASYQKYDKHYGLDAEAMDWFAHHYLGEPSEQQNPLVSPLLAEDVSQLPRTLIIAAEADVLFDEGVAYYEKLQNAGIPSQHLVMPGLIHSYFSKMNFFEQQTKETATIIAKFLTNA